MIDAVELKRIRDALHGRRASRRADLDKAVQRTISDIDALLARPPEGRPERITSAGHDYHGTAVHGCEECRAIGPGHEVRRAALRALPVIRECGGCGSMGGRGDSRGHWCLLVTDGGRFVAVDSSAPPPSWCPLRNRKDEPR